MGGGASSRRRQPAYGAAPSPLSSPSRSRRISQHAVSPFNELPSCGAELRLEWLQRFWSADIESFSLEQVVAETRPGVLKQDGGGASGPSIVRVALTWKAGTSGPASAVLKISNNATEPALPLKTRALLVLTKLYPTELNANELLWYTSNCSAAVANGYAMPRCYAAACSFPGVKRAGNLSIVLGDGRSDFGTVLVLEDLAGFRSHAQHTDLKTADLESVLRNLAVLHGTYWGRFDSATNGEWTVMDKSVYGPCTWLSHVILGTSTSSTFLNRPMLRFHTGRLERAARRKWNTAVGDELFTRFCGCASPLRRDDVTQALAAVRAALADRQLRALVFDNVEPQTILHGDSHGWNNLFVQDAARVQRPESSVAVDFQMLGSGRSAWDIVYFLGMSSSGADCYATDVALLRAYYDGLVAAAARCGNSNFDPCVWTFERLQRDYFAVFLTFVCHSLAYMGSVLTPADQLAFLKQPPGKALEKGETLVFGCLKMWLRSFDKLCSYYTHGFFATHLGSASAPPPATPANSTTHTKS
jgi:hypothetical protein